MASSTACATCASSYDSPIDPISEKPLLPGRYLSCCTRSICARCLNQNKRYETYCPYCQISSESSLLPQGLRDPPAYSPLNDQGVPPPESKPPILTSNDDEDELPAYSQHQPVQPPPEKQEQDQERAPDVLHFLTPSDTLSSLALAYKVPLPALRKANNVFSDHLIQGRRTVIIPGEFYKGGVSLSPQPPEGEEEEMRRNKVRRWMVSCKVADVPPRLRYDVALLYLQQAEWDLEVAVEAYREDERWEREHPLEAKAKGKKKIAGKTTGEASKTVGMRRFVGLGSRA
ncbi:hypothetical protein LTR56_004078 [Elasticomyces elasticus]|nr:hypothetical protein LTR56_004078 [Elasticomyces elasticus]KAK3661359.1 hypothetical protein LTR22_007566 [Elasticomyces elasticus]KAK4928946.1 hypothetical protein LTR49_004447 [Elasticomyces elasticus]KAK5765388.1 hypothetical protein LTS12_004401 [Elasticomyces elasticus]